MSESLQELEKVGVESIKLFKDFSEKGIEFVEQQAPQVCEQLVNRALWQSGFVCFVCFLFFVFALCIGLKFNRDFNQIINKPKENRSVDDQVWSALCYCALYAMCIISLLIGTNNLYVFISVYFAPKAFLFDYFTHLITQ